MTTKRYEIANLSFPSDKMIKLNELKSANVSKNQNEKVSPSV